MSVRSVATCGANAARYALRAAFLLNYSISRTAVSPAIPAPDAAIPNFLRPAAAPRETF